MQFSASGDNEQGADTVKPLSGWWVYERKAENGPKEPYDKLDNGSVDGLELLQSPRKARLQMWAEIEVQ